MTAGIWGYVNIGQLENLLEHETKITVTEKYPNDKATRYTVDYTQRNLQCCGAYNYRDWLTSNQDVPESCYCEFDCEGVVTDDNIYSLGCTSALYSFFERNLYIIGGVGIAIGLVQVLGMIFAVLLCCNIRKNSDAEYV
uniref:CD151 antigen-like n=1 Tax=Saccoglossus kowalevskii TaxID=10224 RepID=A0ABM0MEP1_SACKO|nr:PREDICTED: CD151 antigen-like [Saccoglossus kowalevskii]